MNSLKFRDSRNGGRLRVSNKNVWENLAKQEIRPFRQRTRSSHIQDHSTCIISKSTRNKQCLEKQAASRVFGYLRHLGGTLISSVSDECEDEVVGCPDCGTCQILHVGRTGGNIRCVRCGRTLERTNGRSLDAGFACAFTTFALLFPANLLPILHVSILAATNRSLIASSVVGVWGQDWPVAAIIIGLEIIVLPFLRFGLLSAVLGMLRAGRRANWLGPAFRWAEHLDQWAMVDVFLFGAIIGYTRVAHNLTIGIGPGGYCTTRGALQTAVTFTLDPDRIGLAEGRWSADPASQMGAMLATLIGKGLRAELGSSVPVVGGKLVDLTMVKDAPPASLAPGNPPQVPVFGGPGGGLNRTMAQVNDILASVNAMPLDAIAANVHIAAQRLAALARSPETKQSLDNFDRTLAHVDRITRQADAQLPAILADLRQSAAQAQAALGVRAGAAQCRRTRQCGPDDSGLPHALYELSQAAQSLRALADYLSSHPGSLIAGRED